MFFLMSINEEQKELLYDGAMTICETCGRYGRYMVYMTYTVLALFFIPCFKWNKQYYVRMSCCGMVYRLDEEIGKRMARGEHVQILPEHLTPADGGRNRQYQTKRCMNCGFILEEDFEYCPKCGRKL